MKKVLTSEIIKALAIAVFITFFVYGMGDFQNLGRSIEISSIFFASYLVVSRKPNEEDDGFGAIVGRAFAVVIFYVFIYGGIYALIIEPLCGKWEAINKECADIKLANQEVAESEYFGL